MNALTERKEAARAYVLALVEEGMTQFDKGEWLIMVKAHNKNINGDGMEE